MGFNRPQEPLIRLAKRNTVVEAVATDELETGQKQLSEDQFVIEADQVERYKKEYGLTEDELLVSLIDSAKEMARPPVSKYYVGAVGLGESGRIILGVNIELYGMPLNNSVHAEQFVIANAVRVGERRLTKLAVSAAPCGHCRQFMAELPDVEVLQIMVPGAEPALLPALLPQRFGPADLLPAGVGPRLLQPHDHRLVTSGNLKVELHSTKEMRRAHAAALAATNRSYTPYSHSPAGLALVAGDGKIVSGGVIESCAYNPTMGPLHTALVEATACGVEDWTRLEYAVLVERPDAKVQYARFLKMILKEIAPDCRFQVLDATEPVDC